LELTGVLGVGAYGVVYNAIDIYTGTPYAVKALSKHGLDSRQQKFQQREIALHMKASGHRNIVSLVKVVDTLDTTFVILEYCPEGDLFTNITERGHYVGNDYLAKQAFLQLLNAVEYCHSLGVYHRDLKPENVLVSNHGSEIKLADFGLATTDAYTSDFGCGSTFYMSPECQQSTSPSSRNCYASAPNDIWSLGVILVNLTCGRNPWKRASTADSTYRAYLKDRRFLSSILPLSPELNAILQRVFEPNPLLRISLPELKFAIERCRHLTNQPMPPSPTPSVNVVPEWEVDVDCAELDAEVAAFAPAPQDAGLLTPPDSAPQTPLGSVFGQQAQWVNTAKQASSRSTASSGSDASSQYYHDAQEVLHQAHHVPQKGKNVEYVPALFEQHQQHQQQQRSGASRFWSFPFFAHSGHGATHPGVHVF